MPRLSAIKEKTLPFEADIHGEKIKGQFRPAGLTGGRLDEISDIMRRGDIHRGNAEAVAGVVTEWDLVGDDNQPISLDPETLHREVPSRVLSMVMTAIAEAQKPPKKSSTPSGGSFGAGDE